jgi:hypothetical protein
MYGEELDYTNCTPETVAYLSRPDEESEMPLEEWKILFKQRENAGYYDKHGNKILTEEEQIEKDRKYEIFLKEFLLNK